VHLESGLSSGRLTDPFPEELLRRLTFRLTDFALCPNEEACDRMQKVGNCDVVDTRENTLLDCVRGALGSINHNANEDYFVVSIHRFQNIYSRSTLRQIVDGIMELSAIAPVQFILHPPTELRLRKYGLLDRLGSAPGVMLKARMPYTQFLALIAGARGVISDGGSNQEELSYLGVPTVLMRKRSERPDGIGQNVILFDPNLRSIAEYVRTGKLDALRRPAKLDIEAQPSRISIEAITRWAALRSNSESGPVRKRYIG
jgi:UDP-N-acetylglucosamine 2-epimerase (non-hydrolysing)